MQAVRVSLVLFSVFLIALPVSALDDAKAAHAKYDELAAKVNRGDLDIDWRALRLAAVVGEVAGSYDVVSADQRLRAIFQQGDYEGALKIARETEGHTIADGEAHLAAWSCLKQLGRQGEAEKEWGLAQALLESVLRSGDGKSVTTAWFAVGIGEEYFVMEMLQVEFKEQRSVKQDGHYFDMVLVTDQSGKDEVLWFNTDTDIEMLGRAGDKKHSFHP